MYVSAVGLQGVVRSGTVFCRSRLSPENSPDMLAVEAEFMLNCLLSVN